MCRAPWPMPLLCTLDCASVCTLACASAVHPGLRLCCAPWPVALLCTLACASVLQNLQLSGRLPKTWIWVMGSCEFEDCMKCMGGMDRMGRMRGNVDGPAMGRM